MILEAATLQVTPGQGAPFEAVSREAPAIIASMPGGRAHELHRCPKAPATSLLLVRRDRLEDQTDRFRGSPRCRAWSGPPHGFSDPFPTVEHVRAVDLGPDDASQPAGHGDD